jgi:hypothetical protein
MAFEDLITGPAGEDIPAPIDPELVASRAERKGLTDFSARARQPVDFGADDKVIGPGPKPSRAKAVPSADFGVDDEVVDAMYGQTVPLPKPRPAEAPQIVQPTQPMPAVQPLEDAPFRAPSSGMTTNMLTGEEAYAEREANITGAEIGVTEAKARLDAALERQRATAASPPRSAPIPPPRTRSAMRRLVSRPRSARSSPTRSAASPAQSMLRSTLPA